MVGACIGHRGVVHSLVHSQACSGRVGSSIRVYYSQAVRTERSTVGDGLKERGINTEELELRAKNQQCGRVTRWQSILTHSFWRVRITLEADTD